MPIRSRHLTLPAIALVLALPAANAAEGTLTTFAGTTPGLSGDGGPATGAQLNGPEGTAIAADGALLVADTGNDAIRRVAPNGIITTIAGNGRGFFGDGGPAADAELNAPSGVAVLTDGSILIADTGNDRIRRISPGGIITTVAGSARGLAGDGGPAAAALLNGPRGLTPLPGGGYLIADSGNGRIRAVSAAGVMSTVAGTGPGFGGDGGPAVAAGLSDPRSVSIAPDGGLLIADLGNRRIRRVAPGGVITTAAGGGVGRIDESVPALRTRLGGPAGVIPLTNGGFLMADALADRLRRVTPLGTIVTVAGERRDLGGDGGPASGASLDTPTSLTPQPAGGLLIGDTGNARVRRLSEIGTLPPPEARRTVGVTPFGGTVRVRPRATTTFISLREADLAPNESVVDATRGSVDLTVRAPDSSAEATARLSGGKVLVVQPIADTAVADLRLNGPLRCSARAIAGRATESARKKKAKKRPPSRRVRVKVRGRYRTTGRYAVAVANGTAWTITDRCDRTIIRVTEGAVTVRDLRLRRNVRVKARRTYVALARAPRR
jgi:sugar lactone lactonase YvrE